MSDQPGADPVVAIAIGGTFAGILTFLLIGYYLGKRKEWKRNSMLAKVLPSKDVFVVPSRIKLQRKATHDPKDQMPRRIIQRTRAGIELIFSEFDSTGDGSIDNREFKAIVLTLAARVKISPDLLPNHNELNIIFEALDEDASGGLSLDEWNHWILDGLGQPPAERAQAAQTNGLSKKMDIMLCCLEQLANEAGKLLSTLDEKDDLSNMSSRKVNDLPSSHTLFGDDNNSTKSKQKNNNGKGKNDSSFRNWEE